MKVICVGSASKDIFFPTSEGQVIETPEDLESQKKFVFELGAKYHISKRFESLGGCAANQAVGLSRLRILTNCYSTIGDDHIGRWIKDKFFREGISEEFIWTEPDCLSGLSAIVVNKETGDRIIFSNQEANEKLRVIPKRLKEAGLISITDLSGDWRKTLDEIIKIGVENNIKITFNPRGINIKEDSKKISEIAKDLEILFLNKDEAIELLSNVGMETSNNEVEIIKKISSFGSKIIAITDGANGAWAYSGGNIAFAKPLPQNAIDSTGAGDAFSSGFMAAYLKEKNLEECLRWGVANGGNVVNFYGGVEGLLIENDIVEKIKEIKTEIL